MNNNNFKLKISFLGIFVIGFWLNPKTAYTASAVAYGTKSVHSSANHNDIVDAVQTVLENCSKTDSHCVLILKCSDTGFGATVTERMEGLITSIGASCGRDSAEAAKQQALENCEQNQLAKGCALRTFWEDKTN